MAKLRNGRGPSARSSHGERRSAWTAGRLTGCLLDPETTSLPPHHQHRKPRGWLGLGVPGTKIAVCAYFLIDKSGSLCYRVVTIARVTRAPRKHDRVVAAITASRAAAFDLDIAAGGASWLSIGGSIAQR